MSYRVVINWRDGSESADVTMKTERGVTLLVEASLDLAATIRIEVTQ